MEKVALQETFFYYKNSMMIPETEKNIDERNRSFLYNSNIGNPMKGG